MKDQTGSLGRSALWLGVFGFCVSGAYLWLDDFGLFRMGHYLLTREDIGNSGFTALAFVAPCLLGFVGLVLLHGHARSTVRYGAHALAIVSIGVFYGFSAVSERGFTITEASLMWAELEFLPSALGFFFWDYIPVVAPSLIAIGLAEWFARTRLPRLQSLWLVTIPLLAAGLFYSLLSRTDAKVDQFPIPIRVPVLMLYAYTHDAANLEVREPIFFEPAHAPVVDHIVLLIDESIRSDALSLNGGQWSTTPYLESISNVILNYGTASSIANLSAPANIILQSGLRPDQLPDQELLSLRNPSLFSYMQQAGFHSVLINAQNALTRPPNFMSDHDIQGLDEYVQVKLLEDAIPDHMVDMRVPALIARIVSGHPRSFSYVIKNGAHFPYTNKFPEDGRVFAPSDFSEQLTERQRTVLAEYMNTVRWSVDVLIHDLVTALESTGREALIIYTSDHGQSLYETTNTQGRRIRGHGHHDEPPIEQAMVPFFLLPLGQDARTKLSTLYDPALVDRLSAFEFFPSLLYLAGYDEQELRGTYHHTIFDKSADRGARVFVSGNHFGADGPLYRDAPYRSSFRLNAFDSLD